ncbi:hypothetical protein B0T14DRAFT_256549 [Immersiella caudata]|uniref:Secreted protein n=1 Tax=Immersiella caudata TaxID=314043 RepID=A0AA39WKG1_9PEZI|nr:hypothetical protein B0T14DRAFT_256549 [Immersiella caudata]
MAMALAIGHLLTALTEAVQLNSLWHSAPRTLIHLVALVMKHNVDRRYRISRGGSRMNQVVENTVSRWVGMLPTWRCGLLLHAFVHLKKVYWCPFLRSLTIPVDAHPVPSICRFFAPFPSGWDKIYRLKIEGQVLS